MTKWIVFMLSGYILYQHISHRFESDRLHDSLAKLELDLEDCHDKRAKQPACPDFKPCIPTVINLPCVYDCPVIDCPECPQCKSWYEMCLEDE